MPRSITQLRCNWLKAIFQFLRPCIFRRDSHTGAQVSANCHTISREIGHRPLYWLRRNAHNLVPERWRKRWRQEKLHGVQLAIMFRSLSSCLPIARL